ncbi:MAG: hypothetical protein GX111_00225 [Clostridiales bacterium]|nr:hypothetical protein [Clostridiales bacterium]
MATTSYLADAGSFTAIKGDPFFRDCEQFFGISNSLFSRRGAWVALFADGDAYGSCALHLGNNHGARIHTGVAGYNKLFRLYPTFGGKTVPFALQTSAVELTIHTRHGDVRFTFADENTICAQGDIGMGLRITRQAEGYEALKRRKDGAWEAVPRATCAYLFKGTEGSAIAFDDTWDWYKLTCGEICGNTVPGSDGRFSMIIEEFPYSAFVRDSYPSYDEAKASMQADWEAFLEKMPHFIEPFEKERERCAYITWSHLLAPTQLTPKPLILMFPGEMASQWQLVQNAVALQEHPELAIDLLLAPLQRQSAEGKLADSYDETMLSGHGIKPPVYGWALKQIMKRHDIEKEWPRDKIEKLYLGAGRWADWFMTYRDDDGDGLPSLEHPGETGFDEVSLFRDHVQMTSPDLPAYLVLAFEAQGDLAKILKKPDAEIEAWYQKSKTLLKLMLTKMWDGEHFVGLVPYTFEKIFSGSNVHYIPIILGDRLPGPVIDKLVSDLSEENGLLSPYGLATENMLTSDYYETQGVQMGRGAIDPPAEVFICTGLWDAGEKDLARLITKRYCTRLMDKGFSHIISPVTGAGTRFWGTWSRCVFNILCRMISEE